MGFIDIMHEYFRGERIEALCYILPAGLLVGGLAATALASDRCSFGWGMAVPLALFGLTGISVGTYVGVRTPGQVAQIERAYQDDPAQMVAEELPRMEKVNANWPRLIATWTTCVIIGLGLRLLLRADWAHGIGVALVLIGAIGLLIDGFAERRARPYTEALDAISASRSDSQGRPL